MNCSNCNIEIPQDNINIKTDLAHCKNCGEINKISALINIADTSSFEIETTSKGTWYKKERGSLIIGANCWSPIAFFLIPFALVWSGGSLGGIYGTQILSGEFDLMMSLFGLPFLIGSIILLSTITMFLFGKTELTLDNDEGKIFTGVGKLGRTKRFKWSDIDKIHETTSNVRVNNSRNLTKISIKGSKKTTFGMWLNERKQYYLLMSLKHCLNKKKQNRYFV